MSLTITRLADAGVVLHADGFGLALDIGEYIPHEMLDDRQVAAVVSSHLHSDHFEPDRIRSLGAPVWLPESGAAKLAEHDLREGGLLRLDETVSAGPFAITPHEVDHGASIIFGLVIEVEGARAWFAADLGADTLPRPGGRFDVAFLPVGGTWVMDAAEAAAYARHLDLGVAVPIHYDYAPTEGERFAALFERGRVLGAGETIALSDLAGGEGDARG